MRLASIFIMAVEAAVSPSPAVVQPQASTAKVTAVEARAIVEKALPFLREEADAWIEDRGCVSCHQVPFGIWTHVEAKRKGFQVDEAKLDEWEQWSTDWRHWMQPDAETTEEKAVEGSVDTIAQLILALGDVSTAEATKPWVGEFQKDLIGLQEKEGGWRACGQLPLGRRPARETQEVSTMWVRQALALGGDGSLEGLEATQAKSGEWLAQAAPGQSTEWWALKLLEADESEVAHARKQLISKRRPDGGWGWVTGEERNALGTGQAMHALGRTGVSLEDPAVQTALAFLKSTQKEDGSWAVPSTRKKDALKVKKTSIYFGTAWAVLGVLAVLPESE